MTQDEQELHLRERRRQVEYILQRAANYKACDQCRSIMPKSIGHCPWCAAYRFNEDVDYVKATAAEMAGTAVPLGAPVVPRIRREKCFRMVDG